MQRIKHRVLYGTLGLAMAAGLALAPAASVFAATTNMWSGEQITVTFQLPPNTNLNWTPTLGESGANVEEIANMGGGNTNALASISNVDLIRATTNTFVATFDVPAPEYGIMWSSVFFTLALPIDNNPANNYAFGGNSTTTYTYVSPPPPPPPTGQVPEVPIAAALPFIGLVAYGGIRAREMLNRRTIPSRGRA